MVTFFILIFLNVLFFLISVKANRKILPKIKVFSVVTVSEIYRPVSHPEMFRQVGLNFEMKHKALLKLC